MILMSDVAGGDDDGKIIILHAFFKKMGSVLSVQNGCLCSREKAQNSKDLTCGGSSE